VVGLVCGNGERKKRKFVGLVEFFVGMGKGKEVKE